MPGANAQSGPGDVTRLIARLKDDGDAAARHLLPLVYQELRALAQSFFNNERPGHTLQPTAVVHEAFIRLVGDTPISFQGRSHFFMAAAKAMRHVLTDHARHRRAAKRGGDWQRVTLSGIGSDASDRAFDSVEIDEALTELEEQNQRWAQIVELRFFCGMTVAEVADTLGISERTVSAEWRLARALLRRSLGKGEPA